MKTAQKSPQPSQRPTRNPALRRTIPTPMNVETTVTKGRDGWEAVSMIHIPGRPLIGNDSPAVAMPEYTHVRVHTSKASRGGLYCYASEVTKTHHGFSCIMDFHEPQPWERLGESPDRCTEKSVRLLHQISLFKLKELRPELFGEPLPHEQNEVPTLSEPVAEREDRESIEDDEDDAGRFVPRAVTAPFVEGGMNWRPLLTIMLLLTMALGARAQTITRDANGNFTEVERLHVEHDSTTAYTFTYQREGRSFTIPVYQGPKGGLYVWMPTEKGTPFRRYLPKQ